MPGLARIYRPDGVITEPVRLLYPPDRAFFEKALGGHAERILGFDYLFVNSAFWPCVAFRNGRAKRQDLALNAFLDNLWKRAASNGYGNKLSFLYGPVLVITGDDVFLEATVAEWMV